MENFSVFLEENVDVIVEEGVVDVFVFYFCLLSIGEGEGFVFCEYEVEKDVVFVLGLFVVKVR